MKTVRVYVDWNSRESIKIAEKAKAALENNGYVLLNQFGGLFHTVMIYRRLAK